MTFPTPEQRVELRRWATDIADNDPDDELANRVLDVLEWGEALEAEAAAWKEVADRTTVLLGECWGDRDAARAAQQEQDDHYLAENARLREQVVRLTEALRKIADIEHSAAYNDHVVLAAEALAAEGISP